MRVVRQGEQHEHQQHDEVAVRGVGEPHHAEHERLPHREEPIQRAEQHALHDDIDERVHATAPKYACVIASSDTSADTPASDTRPSWKQ